MMTKFQDLCARLPHKPKCYCKSPEKDLIGKLQGIEGERVKVGGYYFWISEVKLYLRPLSQMTEEEKRELQSFYPGCFGSQWLNIEKGIIEIFECESTITLNLLDNIRILNFFYSHHLDPNGLIEIGEAIEATPEMYKRK